MEMGRDNAGVFPFNVTILRDGISDFSAILGSVDTKAGGLSSTINLVIAGAFCSMIGSPSDVSSGSVRSTFGSYSLRGGLLANCLG